MKTREKVLAVVLAVAIGAAVAGCGTSADSSSGTIAKPVTASSDSAQNLGEEGDLANGHIKITAVDYFDTGNSFFTIEWTNSTNSATTFDKCFDVEIFQNGAKLNRTENATKMTDTSGVTYDPQELTREVQPGSTLKVYYPFDLLPNSISGDKVIYDSLKISIYSKGDRSKKVEYMHQNESTSSSDNSATSSTILSADAVSSQIILDFLNSYNLPKGSITMNEYPETGDNAGKTQLNADVYLDTTAYDSPASAAKAYIQFAADLSQKVEESMAYNSVTFFYNHGVSNTNNLCDITCTLESGKSKFSTNLMNTLSDTDWKSAMDTAYKGNAYFNERDSYLQTNRNINSLINEYEQGNEAA